MKKTLLEIRKEKKIKQKPILELMQINRKTLYRWEHLKTAPGHWQLMKLCQYYGADPEQVQISTKRYDPYAFLGWKKTKEEYDAERAEFIRETNAWYDSSIRKPFEKLRQQWETDGSFERWKL